MLPLLPVVIETLPSHPTLPYPLKANDSIDSLSMRTGQIYIILLYILKKQFVAPIDGEVHYRWTLPKEGQVWLRSWYLKSRSTGF